MTPYAFAYKLFKLLDRKKADRTKDAALILARSYCRDTASATFWVGSQKFRVTVEEIFSEDQF